MHARIHKRKDSQHAKKRLQDPNSQLILHNNLALQLRIPQNRWVASPADPRFDLLLLPTSMYSYGVQFRQPEYDRSQQPPFIPHLSCLQQRRMRERSARVLPRGGTTARLRYYS